MKRRKINELFWDDGRDLGVSKKVFKIIVLGISISFETKRELLNNILTLCLKFVTINYKIMTIETLMYFLVLILVQHMQIIDK